jgi:hypothetical protein
MIELLILLTVTSSVAAGFYYLGWQAHRRSVLRDIEKMMNQLIVNVRLESVNNGYLLYHLDSNEFLCQADTLEKIAERFTEKMGREHVGVLSWQGQQLIIVEGKIESAESVF